MSSKEDILASIRKNTKNRYEYPDWQINATVYPDVVAKFCEMSFADRKSTRLNSSHIQKSRMPSSA